MFNRIVSTFGVTAAAEGSPSFWENTWTVIRESNVLQILWALVILVLGWIVATVLARLVEKLLLKLNLSERMNKHLPETAGNDQKVPRFERIAGRFVYFLVLLFVLIGILSVLQLGEMAEPINRFFARLSDYAANIIGAGVLVLIAFVVATVLKYAAIRILGASGRLDSALKLGSSKPETVSKVPVVVGNAVYWLTWLFFLPAILTALQIEGITAPLSSMLEKVLAFLPHLAAAVIILLVGLWAARLVRRAVTNLISASSLDAVGEKAGVRKVFGNSNLSGMIGIVAYVLVAIPVIIASLTALQIDSLTDSITGIFEKILDATANALGAAVVLFAAFIIGGLVASLVTQLFAGFGFDRLLTRLGFKLKDNENGQSIAASAVVGKIAFVAVMLFAAITACNLMNFHGLSALLVSFAYFGGNILVAVVVMIIGIALANFAADALRGAGAHANLLAMIVRVAVLVFTAAIALSNLEIGSDIVRIAFAMLLGAVCVAFAIAFGVGGRDFAAKKLQKLDDKLNRKN